MAEIKFPTLNNMFGSDPQKNLVTVEKLRDSMTTLMEKAVEMGESDLTLIVLASVTLIEGIRIDLSSHVDKLKQESESASESAAVETDKQPEETEE